MLHAAADMPPPAPPADSASYTLRHDIAAAITRHDTTLPCHATALLCAPPPPRRSGRSRHARRHMRYLRFYAAMIRRMLAITLMLMLLEVTPLIAIYFAYFSLLDAAAPLPR